MKKTIIFFLVFSMAFGCVEVNNQETEEIQIVNSKDSMVDLMEGIMADDEAMNSFASYAFELGQSLMGDDLGPMESRALHSEPSELLAALFLRFDEFLQDGYVTFSEGLEAQNLGNGLAIEEDVAIGADIAVESFGNLFIFPDTYELPLWIEDEYFNLITIEEQEVVLVDPVFNFDLSGKISLDTNGQIFIQDGSIDFLVSTFGNLTTTEEVEYYGTILDEEYIPTADDVDIVNSLISGTFGYDADLSLRFSIKHNGKGGVFVLDIISTYELTIEEPTDFFMALMELTGTDDFSMNLRVYDFEGALHYTESFSNFTDFMEYFGNPE